MSLNGSVFIWTLLFTILFLTEVGDWVESNNDFIWFGADLRGAEAAAAAAADKADDPADAAWFKYSFLNDFPPICLVG